MKILISDPIEKVCVEILKSEGFEVEEATGLKPEALKDKISAVDALVVRSSTQVTADVLAAAKHLRVVGRAGAGVDNIDVEAATRRGIIVMNTPGGNTVSTAEHTVSMILALCRNIPQANESLKQGKWERKQFVGTELSGKTIGVVGMGKVGREVAVRCQSFGMRTIGFDPVLSAEVAAKMRVELVSLAEIFAQSDIITVHTPLNDETRGLIGEAQFARCRRGVRIVNCARGGIINEKALLAALESEMVAGAALDVFEQEPPGDNPLLRHPRVIATPHLGASTEEAQEKVAQQIGRQLADVLKDRGIVGAVNAEAIQLAMKKELKPYVLLAEKLGSLQAQLMQGALKTVTISCSGNLLTQAQEVISAAVLKGIFSHVMTEPVNLVNAPAIARELGVVFVEKREAEHADYSNLIGVAYETDVEKRAFAGTVFGSSHLRIVKIDDFHFEVNPEGHLLFYRNIDKPGMLARVGGELATAGVNIAGLALGREGPGQKALTIINTDSPVSPEILKKLGRMEGVFDVRSARL